MNIFLNSIVDSQRKSYPKFGTSTDDSKQNLSDVVSTSEKGINDTQNKISGPGRGSSPTSMSHGPNPMIPNVLPSAEQEVQDEMLTIKADTYAGKFQLFGTKNNLSLFML